MFNIIKRIFHIHSWGNWEYNKKDFLITPTFFGVTNSKERFEVTKAWQQRQCLKCGKIEQQDLNY